MRLPIGKWSRSGRSMVRACLHSMATVGRCGTSEGHWVLIRGVKLCDTFSQGKWQFVVDGPHISARIMEVFEVKRSIDAM